MHSYLRCHSVLVVRRTPRIDTADHVKFVNDQLAVRFIEEIDFDYAANDATAALLTAAS